LVGGAIRGHDPYFLDVFQAWNQTHHGRWRRRRCGEGEGTVRQEGPIDPPFQDGGLGGCMEKDKQEEEAYVREK
jgi:hypothetical protein